MIILDDIAQCTGCTACEEVCPLNCIDMTPNEQGFLYPRIDEEKCTECGLCKKVCPGNATPKEQTKRPVVYAVKHTSQAVRFESTSGGMFTALFDYVIGQGGVVFGVQFDNKMKVVHAKATTIHDCQPFRGSKYVQSTKGSIFKEVKKELKGGTLVLFSGTPCEIAGLNSYLLKSYKNLITCDFVCHGVPSPRIWDEYVSYIGKKIGSPLISFSFRNKSLGWHQSLVKKVFADDQEFMTPLAEESFSYLYFSNLPVRSSCSSCQYSNLNRPSDLTMGDFWTIYKVDKLFDDNRGISQVLINTDKGKDIFDKASNCLIFFEAKLEDSLQHNLKMPTPSNPNSTKFWADYSSKGFKYIIRRYRPRFLLTKKVLRALGLFERISNIKRIFSSKN